MTQPIDLDALEALLTTPHNSNLCYATPAERTALSAIPALITEIRRLREYVALLEQATGTMIQVKRGVFEPSSVFSRSECVFKYCMCPALCQEQCMLTKRGATQ
jgi:hypothetical protein